MDLEKNTKPMVRVLSDRIQLASLGFHFWAKLLRQALYDRKLLESRCDFLDDHRTRGSLKNPEIKCLNDGGIQHLWIQMVVKILIMYIYCFPSHIARCVIKPCRFIDQRNANMKNKVTQKGCSQVESCL